MTLYVCRRSSRGMYERQLDELYVFLVTRHLYLYLCHYFVVMFIGK